jgi:hypothetical protein
VVLKLCGLKSGNPAASKAALKIARIGDAVLQWRRARPTAWNCCVSPSYQRRLILSLSALCIAVV